MKRVFKALAIAAAVVVALVSCKKEAQPSEVALTGIELNATTQALQVGQEFQLTVTYKPENATTKPAATWASDTPAVATVDAGKVVAVSAGSAKITATVGTFTASCTVTVTSAEEEILPVEGNSEWSIIGALLGANWDKDFVAAKEGDIYVVKNVKLAADNQFKFRKDKDWAVNRGAEGDVEPYKLTAGTAITVVHNGKNLAAPGDGIYDIYYNAAVEQVCLVAKDGTPKWNEPEPEGIIAIDGDFSDWAEIEAVSNGTHKEFKVALDDNYLYLYTKRVKGEGDAASGYEEMWGHSGEGYVYVALDLDKNPETGEMLWSNGPYEFVGYSWPFGGSASAPEIRENPGASNTNCAPSTCTMKNILCKGVIGTDEVTIEYRIPRADLPAIPETPFIVYSWGSLGLDRAEYHVGEAQPVKEYVHDYTPSAEYLAETNLWKAVDAAGSDFFIINCINGEWPRSAEATSEGVYALTHEQSTYKMHYDVASGADWERQLFLFPKAENAIAIEKDAKYNVKMTFYANKDLPRVFMKVVNYQADKDNKEGSPLLFGDEIKSVKAGQPTVFEYKDVPGAADTENLTFVIDFGGAPADVDIYVKDIIIEKAKEEVQLTDLSTINALAAGADFELNAIVAETIEISGTNSAAIVTDGENCFYLFFNPADNNTLVKGDLVNAKGKISVYNHLIESAKNPEFTVLEQGVTVPELTPIEIASFDTFVETDHPTGLYTATGKYVIDGNYTNLKIDGDSKDASLSGEIDAKWEGKTVTIVGWFTGCSGNASHTYIRVVDIEEAGGAPAEVNITIDGDFSDWDAVQGVSNGTHASFKVASDDEYVYFYSHRGTGGRYGEIWGGGGYIYVGFNLDGDDSTGETLNGKGPYEFVFFVSPYGGSADAPAIADDFTELGYGASCLPSTCSIDNVFGKGAVTEDGAIIEFRVPRADMPSIPASEITVYSTGNKDLATVSITCTL